MSDDTAPVRQVLDIRIPMRDGVRLSADVYFPPAGPAGGPYPTLLFRTPYDNQAARYIVPARRFSDAGYVAVLQDVRGRFDSDGDWLPYRKEGPDGFDSIEWLATQPWSNGRIGTWGASYTGYVQWAAARERPPHLVTMVSTAAVGRWFEEVPYMNGALLLRHVQWLNLTGGRTNQDGSIVDWNQVLWHLPLRTLPDVIRRDLPGWRDWMTHSRLDEYWRAIRLDDDFPRIDLPVLHITGWYDADQPGALFFYNGMRSDSPAATRQSIVIGPWDHVGTIENRAHIDCVEFGAAAVLDMPQMHIDWFDRWLKSDPPQASTAVARLFLTGENRWSRSTSWPPPDAEEVQLFLVGSGDRGGTIARVEPSATSAAFRYDPADPVMLTRDLNQGRLTTPGAAVPDPPMELSRLEGRRDILVYTSDPFEDRLIVVGEPRLVIYGSSDCPDTDWSVWLTDVGPAGSIFLAHGILRARFHGGLDHEELLVPGETYRFEVPLRQIGHVFAPGHRLRVLISSSFFPSYDRNPNTGHPIGADAELRVANNVVFHGRGQASHLKVLRWDPPS